MSEDAETGAMTETQATEVPESDSPVVYLLRDRNMRMVTCWQKLFEDYPDRVKASHGDIFEDAPGADALVSPANSFGFMDGGIDMAYTMHFGWQMQHRLQEIIRREKHGELLVGDAIIMRTFEGGATEDSMDWSRFNEGQPVKYLISAPTMRVPLEVDDSVNAYLAFRAVILAVQDHNRKCEDKIRTVLTPGLGTAVGNMPPARCAFQMLQAFETFDLGLHDDVIKPHGIFNQYQKHEMMTHYKDNNIPVEERPPPRGRAAVAVEEV